jgi:hypothetical protein
VFDVKKDLKSWSQHAATINKSEEDLIWEVLYAK